MSLRHGTIAALVLWSMACSAPHHSNVESAQSAPAVPALPTAPLAEVPKPTPADPLPPLTIELEPADSSDEQRPPVPIDSEEPGMKAAIDKARATVTDFASAFQNPRPTYCCFSFKYPFAENDQTEHMWISLREVRDGRLLGIVNNTPVRISQPVLGQTVDLDAKEITDWMYFDRDVLRGGYSIRFLYSRMSPEEQAQFHTEFPARFD